MSNFPIEKLSLIVIQAVTYILYYFYTKRNFGIQSSISDVFRRSQEKFGNSSALPWIFFYGFMLGVGLPLHLIVLSGWSFFTLVGLLFAATASQFWLNDATENVHVIGATGGIILAFVAFGFKMWLISSIFFAVFLILLWLLRPIRNYTWWTESIALFMVMVLEVVYIFM